MKQYKITIRGTNIFFLHSGRDAEEAFFNMMNVLYKGWEMEYSRDTMLHYMDAYHIVEIAG